MKRLFTEPDDVIISELRDFMSQYKAWIDRLKTQILSLDSTRKASAEANISKCENAWRTISKTITEMEKDSHSDGLVFRAFRLANEAMYLQRERSLIRQEKPVNAEEINWYPFQLAFLLQEMISFIDPKGEERKIVDLLWFPTGGGKTEAYLGIAAFVIFGDVKLAQHCAKELAKKINKKSFDYIVCPEAKVLPLAQAYLSLPLL